MSVVCSTHRDRPALTSGPAESPEATGGQLDPQGDGKQAVTAPSPETAMQPAPSPPGPLRESVPRGSAQGCSGTPASPPEGPSMPRPQSPAPRPPLETQESSEDGGAEELTPIQASSAGLGPPTAPPSPRPPAEPPRSRTTQEAGQEPESPPLAAQGPSLATGNPDSPGAAPGGQPEAPQPADRKLCPSSVDAPPLPEGVACPALQEATRLIQEEFASDGYLDRGLEALIMGTRGHRAQEQGWARGDGGGHHGARRRDAAQHVRSRRRVPDPPAPPLAVRSALPAPETGKSLTAS